MSKKIAKNDANQIINESIRKMHHEIERLVSDLLEDNDKHRAYIEILEMRLEHKNVERRVQKN